MNRVGSYNSGLYTGFHNASDKVEKTDDELNQGFPEKTPEKNRLHSSITNRPLENLSKLSPIDQYKYMANNGQQAYTQPNLKEIPGNPEATIRKANRIINSATMPPMLSNPDRAMLDEAMQLKRRMVKNLDRVA